MEGIGSHLFIEQVPYAGWTSSMRVSQEPDQHYCEEHCVGGQNGSDADQATACLQGEARPRNRVVPRFDLLSTQG